MNTKTLVTAALASVIAITAAAPSFAAPNDPAHQEKRIHRMIHRADTDHDGRVSPAEMQAALDKTFTVLDTNHDGVLSKAEIDNRRETFKAYRAQLKAERQSGQHVKGVIAMPRMLEKRFAKIDADGNGQLSKTELDGIAAKVFKHRDRNNDGYISAADFKA